MKKLISIIVVIAVALAIIVLLPLSGEASGPAQPPQLQPPKTHGPIIITAPTPAPSATRHIIYPTPNPGLIDLPVSVPDPMLNQELHSLCGIPLSDSLTMSDLAGLTGSVDLSYKHIQDLEGIQYCTNIEKLDASNNELVMLPENINKMNDLLSLNINHNDITHLPASMWSLPKLNALDISDNRLEALAEGIGGTRITKLNIAHNDLFKLPEDFGTSLTYLNAAGNMLRDIPESVSESALLTFLYLEGNMLTEVPAALQNKVYDEIDVEWNFIDMSPGSPSKAIMDSIAVSIEKKYMRQLKPLRGLAAESTENSVTLRWEQAQGGQEGEFFYEPLGYNVYLRYPGGEVGILAELLPESTFYTHTGLNNDTEYEYLVSVEYQVSDVTVSMITSHFLEISARTASAAVESEEPTLTPASDNEDGMPQETDQITFTPGPKAIPTEDLNVPADRNQQSDVPAGSFSWIIILVIAGSLLLVLAVIAVLLNIKKQRKSKAE